MRSLAISGVALVALMVSQSAFAGIYSRVGAPVVEPMPAPPVAPKPGMPTAQAPAIIAPPPVANDPNRRLDYQRPSYGFQLPQSWMTPENAIDYREFGLDRPARGFGWSRYYDDVVLSDQWGRVYDVADDYDRGGRWDTGRRHTGRYDGRDSDGIAGSFTGAAVGAVAGNVIAGAGSRLAGSLIGGGVGALVGLGVELALKKDRHHRPRYDDRAHNGGRYREDDDHGRYSRGHWGGFPAQTWGYQSCNCGGDTVTTTTITYEGGGYAVPHRVVTYENVYAPDRTKYVTRAAAPTKYRVREEAPTPAGKARERTKLHTQTY